MTASERIREARATLAPLWACVGCGKRSRQTKLCSACELGALADREDTNS